MKNLSRLGKNNPHKTQLIIAIGKIIIAIESILVGCWIYFEDIQIPEIAFSIFAGIFIIVTFLYPHRSSKKGIFKYAYAKQKVLDGILVLLGPILIIISINNFTYNSDYAHTSSRPVATFVVHKTTTKPKLFNQKKNIKEQLCSFKKQVKAEMKILKSEYKKAKTKFGVTQVMLLLLTIAVFIVLGYLIIALGCSLSCSGNDAAAVLVVVGGGVGLVWLTIIVLKKIFRMSKKEIPVG